MIRYVAGSNEPIYPIGYVQNRFPMAKKESTCSYTEVGRKELHDNLRINTKLLHQLMQSPIFGQSIELADNKLSLFSAQYGKCAITGYEFQNISEIHCHHKIPKHLGGTDEYSNLILITDQIHKLIHATKSDTIAYYLKVTCLNKEQISKLNVLRKMAGNTEITL